jgi:hypothetical protein
MKTTKLHPKNQHQQVLYYLFHWSDFSLKDVINDSFFVKFQTRLSEIESEHGTLATRTRVKFINKFGRKSDYNNYDCLDKDRVLELFNNYN